MRGTGFLRERNSGRLKGKEGAGEHTGECDLSVYKGTKYLHVLPYRKHGIIETGKNSLVKKKIIVKKNHSKTKTNKQKNKQPSTSCWEIIHSYVSYAIFVLSESGLFCMVGFEYDGLPVFLLSFLSGQVYETYLHKPIDKAKNT